MLYLIHHIEEIVKKYRGETPLSLLLSRYYKQYPKLGSRDRKVITQAVYLYYRFALYFPKDTAVFVVIRYAVRHFNAHHLPYLEKILVAIELEDVEAAAFPLQWEEWKLKLSPALSPKDWLASLLRQPRLFLRIRNSQDGVMAILNKEQIPFEWMPVFDREEHTTRDCIALPNGTAVDKLLSAGDYVVQDWASQRTIGLLLASYLEGGHTYPETIWDVCSGAGGKSILLKDRLPAHRLLATDIRDNILFNFNARFKQYGLRGFKTLKLDVANKNSLEAKIGNRLFDLVLCDVPCSGSGTWARTPEQFYFFDPDTLSEFSALQYTIASNALAYLKPGGVLAYITCSVFEQENEGVVQQLLQHHIPLQLKEQQVIAGSSLGADNMFVALMIRQ